MNILDFHACPDMFGISPESKCQSDVFVAFRLAELHDRDQDILITNRSSELSGRTPQRHFVASHTTSILLKQTR